LENKRKTVFLDRDGVIIVENNFQCDPKSIDFIPGSIQALRSLSPNYITVVISNQSGISRGYFSKEDVERFQEALDKMLQNAGVTIAAWYFCPHGPGDGCSCRKPSPGMIFRAAQELPIDLDGSWMVGDKSSDVAAGKAAGLKTVLVNTGYAGREPYCSPIDADFIADDLLAAVNIINKEKQNLSGK
jgi:D-glycero-D-manno-heptose 1,7-bisphosphate phosphatase